MFTRVLGSYVSSTVLLVTFRRALTASVDSCPEINIECLFSGVTSSGSVWRKMPESDARSEHALCLPPLRKKEKARQRPLLQIREVAGKSTRN